MFLSVEPAAVCQLHCPECPVGRGANRQFPENPFMSREVWQRVLTEAKPFVHTIQFYFQGEPLLNKDLPLMIREAHEAGIYTIVSTNAQALTREIAEELVSAGLNRIIISMDGLTQDSYSAYRIGGNVERCREALRWLRDAKGTLIIELQVLRLRTNEQEWDAFRREYKKMGADRLVFKTAQLYDYADGHPLMPSDPRYSRYVKGTDGRYHRRPLSKGCFRVWSGAVITSTGEVLPCCYDKSHAHSFGNIMEAPLAELYNNEKAVAFRREALRHKPQICHECWK